MNGMAMNRSVSQYKANQFNTADKGTILLMMYDGAIRFVGEAKEKMMQNDKAGQGIYIGKAIDIISELNMALDMEVGGDVAVSLERLYNFITRELTTANIKSIPKPLEACIRILNNLKEAWVQVVNNNNTDVQVQERVSAQV